MFITSYYVYTPGVTPIVTWTLCATAVFEKSTLNSVWNDTCNTSQFWHPKQGFLSFVKFHTLNKENYVIQLPNLW